jgi:hypothetical protein
MQLITNEFGSLLAKFCKAGSILKYQYQWYFCMITDPDCFSQISGTQKLYYGIDP